MLETLQILECLMQICSSSKCLWVPEKMHDNGIASAGTGVAQPVFDLKQETF